MRRVVGVVLLLVAAGCATGSKDTPAAAPSERASSPLRLRWEEKGRTERGVRLVAYVERLAPLPMPMVVRLEVPAGASLLQGRARFEVAQNQAYEETHEEVVLAYDALPAGDLVLHANAESKVAGFHGAAVYRFGRAEPQTEAVPATGAHVMLNGKDLGPSVPIGGTK